MKLLRAHSNQSLINYTSSSLWNSREFGSSGLRGTVQDDRGFCHPFSVDPRYKEESLNATKEDG